MLTLARLAASITDSNRALTLGGMARPSVKNTTLLRPGIAFIALTTAISALAVAKPCSSRSSDWNVSAIRRWMVANCASAAAPPMSDDAPPWPAPPVMLLSALLRLDQLVRPTATPARGSC